MENGRKRHQDTFPTNYCQSDKIRTTSSSYKDFHTILQISHVVNCIKRKHHEDMKYTQIKHYKNILNYKPSYCWDVQHSHSTLPPNLPSGTWWCWIPCRWPLVHPSHPRTSVAAMLLHPTASQWHHVVQQNGISPWPWSSSSWHVYHWFSNDGMVDSRLWHWVSQPFCDSLFCCLCLGESTISTASFMGFS